MPLYGVDVSRYQGRVDWARVKSEGFTFAICRATKGAAHVDPTWAANNTGMRAAGLVPGAYHVATREDPQAQAEHLLAQFDARRYGSDPDGTLLAVDVEPYTDPDGTANRVDPDYGVVTELFARLHDALGRHRPVLLYTGRWFWAGSKFGDPPGRALTPHLWDSRYVPGEPAYASVIHARIPPTAAWYRPYGGWPAPRIMQFTDRAKVAGKQHDADAFYGTAAELDALARLPKPNARAGHVASGLQDRLGPRPGSAYPDSRGWLDVAADLLEGLPT